MLRKPCCYLLFPFHGHPGHFKAVEYQRLYFFPPRSILQLGSVAPASSNLIYKKLFRSLVSKRGDDITRMMAGYYNPFGNGELRRQIDKRTLGVTGSKIDPEEILVTNGCMEAINLCLRAITQPGDTALIEHVDIGFLETL